MLEWTCAFADHRVVRSLGQTSKLCCESHSTYQIVLLCCCSRPVIRISTQLRSTPFAS